MFFVIITSLTGVGYHFRKLDVVSYMSCLFFLPKLHVPALQFHGAVSRRINLQVFVILSYFSKILVACQPNFYGAVLRRIILQDSAVFCRKSDTTSETQHKDARLINVLNGYVDQIG